MDDVEQTLFVAGNDATDQAAKIRLLIETVSQRDPSMGQELRRLSDSLDDAGGALLQLATRWHDSD